AGTTEAGYEEPTPADHAPEPASEAAEEIKVSPATISQGAVSQEAVISEPVATKPVAPEPAAIVAETERAPRVLKEFVAELES
ncbi:hypothetical protein Q8G50_33605, partial [Klebsiella pneumoniae]